MIYLCYHTHDKPRQVLYLNTAILFTKHHEWILLRQTHMEGSARTTFPASILYGALSKSKPHLSHFTRVPHTTLVTNAVWMDSFAVTCTPLLCLLHYTRHSMGCILYMYIA